MSEPVVGVSDSGTRWLGEQEQQVWRSFVAATEMLEAHLAGQLQRDSNMPYTHYEVLVRLSEAVDYTMRMSDLAAACHASRSRLSHAVAKMEDSGWVRRTSCPTDKRGAFAILTAEGLHALERAAPGHVAAVRRHLFDVLTNEQVSALGEIGAAIVAGLERECAAAGETADEVGGGDGETGHASDDGAYRSDRSAR